ncbi:hypothetical protein UFOVP1655_165 [uncultured Caudovirales phage]|jgi:hypothetical protein|uniref:Uncharacterized protein n=1 Tax=uncultured Caudovirales phage TaxID=2100421 RepID=A0A6J5T4J8_9CAUD|nr:hypothetical protein UFOVP1655_165 [uncultured Caudovirales phage]
MKNIYEVLDEIDAAPTKRTKMNVIERNLSKALTDVFLLAYHPDYQWLVKEIPDQYLPKDTIPGMGNTQLSTEMRRLYLFRKGDAGAENLSVAKRNELLTQFLEAIEPREAEVVMGIFNKDLGVEGLDYAFIKEAFPNLLP